MNPTRPGEFISSRPKLFDADGPSALDIEAYMNSGPHDDIQTPQTARTYTSGNTIASSRANDSAKAEPGPDDLPTWAELKTKAGKDRKRLPLACIACRRKKIRCSGEKPACKHCSKSRVPCVYKITTRKAAPRTDYMAMLDRRLKRMEDRVIKIIPKDEGKPAIPRAVVKPTPTTAGPGAAHQKRPSQKRTAAEAFGAKDVQQWAANARSESDPRRLAAVKVDEDEEADFFMEGQEMLPSPEIQGHLVEVYFDYVYGQSYLLLHKPSFIRLMSAGKVPPVLLLAVCAIAARFSTHPELDSDPPFLRGENWAQEAQRLALKRVDQPNLTILTVLLLLGLHAFGTCQGGRSWMLAGIAHRMAYALQIQIELEHDPAAKNGKKSELSFLDREIRRRTMWGCFVMDRFNSSGTERPMFANEQHIQIQLPVQESIFQMELAGQTEMLDGTPGPTSTAISEDLLDQQSNMGVAAYNVKIISLWGRLIQYWNLGGLQRDAYPIWAKESQWQLLLNETEKLGEAWPSRLRYTTDNLQAHANENIANQFLYMHIAYNVCILFLHRFAFPAVSISKPPKDMPKEFLGLARRRGVDAAGAISALVGKGLEYRLVVPFSGYSAYLSGVVHVHAVFSRDPSLEVQSKEHLTDNIRFLTRMKKHWGMFYFLTESLKELYRQHADAAGKGTLTPDPRVAPKRALQFGDWYDRYPRGVSQTYFEEPAAKAGPTREAVMSQKPDLQSVEDFFASQPQPSAASRRTNNKRPKTKPSSTGSKAGAAEAKMSRTEIDPSLDHMEMKKGQFGLPESFDRSRRQAGEGSSQLGGGEVNQQQYSGLGENGNAFFNPPSMPMVPEPLSASSAIPGTDGLGNFWDMDLTGFTDDFLGGNRTNSWFVPFNVNVPDQMPMGDFSWTEQGVGGDQDRPHWYQGNG